MQKGLAQRLMAERQGRADLGPNSSRWPLLESMRQNGQMDAIDLLVAIHSLPESATEAEGLLIAFLSASSRLGHLCVSFSGHEIQPAVKDVWPEATDVAYIEDLLKQAQGLTQPFVIKDGNRIYLQRYWEDETAFIHALPSLLNTPPDIAIDASYIEAKVHELQGSGQLLEQQANAILHACHSSLTILTGGPGTGKTYTAGMLIRLLWESLPAELQPDLCIALAAPTGKAVNNVQASLQRAVADLPGFPEIRAGTLHSLLKINPQRPLGDPTPIGADIILVDESSMIDVSIMGQLFSSIVPGTRLILLGDNCQLPPVEAGGLFADLVKALPQHAVVLKKCMRAELQGIVAFGEAINSGDEAAVHALLTEQPEGLAYRELPKDAEPLRELAQLVKTAEKYFVQDSYSGMTEEELLDSFNQFRVLTPFRKGPFGVEALNKLFIQTFKPQIAPILILKSDSFLQLYNGDVGVLVMHPDGTADYALFPGKKIPAVLLPSYEIAYCMSVHKSQGSEYGHVLLLLPDRSECFGREILYTAATRARKKIELWACPETLSKVICKKSCRQSGVIDRMTQKGISTCL